MMRHELTERPVLFSGPMVRAILTCAKCGHLSITFPCEKCGSEDFLKTMTRRVVKDKFVISDPDGFDKFNIFERIKNPYRVGMKLWVRETWHCDNPAAAQDIMSRGEDLYYRATEEHPEIFPKWKPSIFMPRWASRITLEIVSVKVERLTEITEEDAIKEGIPKLSFYNLLNQRQVDDQHHRIMGDFPPYYVRQFQDLWDSINGKKHPWSSNPWVSAIEFKRMEAL